MKSFRLMIIFSLISVQVNAQNMQADKRIEQIADSLYKYGNYLLAANRYLEAVRNMDFDTKKRDMYYNAACCFALASKADSAILVLRKAVGLGYTNKKHFTTDPDLISVHTHPEWTKLVAEIPEVRSLNSDPMQARFITEDVYRFWGAYDKASLDSANARHIFRQVYFDKASRGMKDYMGIKVSSIDYFVKHVQSAPLFYNSIRGATLEVDGFKEKFYRSFVILKELYPLAKFPDVYFVIGALTSGGTVSDAGLLIGLNQTCLSKDTPVDEIDKNLRMALNEARYLPQLIAHELVHFQQQGMKWDTTTLSRVVREGMADFLGELISGGTANPKLYDWAIGREKDIWERFKVDAYQDKHFNWIGNHRRSDLDNLPDQGYWVGYQICKAYYDKAQDKKLAIVQMLNIQDYTQFLNQSGWEDKFGK